MFLSDYDRDYKTILEKRQTINKNAKTENFSNRNFQNIFFVKLTLPKLQQISKCHSPVLKRSNKSNSPSTVG